MKEKSINYPLIIIFTIFGLIYASITFVNHYCFRTYALDLGAYTNAAYKYAHFLLADNNVFKSTPEPMLGGHFDLYLVLFSPLTYVFGSYTLLIVQWLAILFGGIGIYRLFQWSYLGSKISYYAIGYFYCFYGVYAALSFDYHSVVVASSLLPWFFLNIRKNKFYAAIILFLLFIIAQENTALWMVFITSGLAFYYRKERKKKLILLFFSLVSIVYFTTILKMVIPYFSYEGEYTGFNFSILGDNISDFITNFFLHPLKSIKILFINHSEDPYFDGIKTETWIMLLISGGWVLIRKPVYIWMLIPIFFQKLYHDMPVMWSVNYQYSIEFAPIFTIGIFDVIMTLKYDKQKYYFSNVILVMALTATIRLMDKTIIMYDKDRLRIYKSEHYKKEFSIQRAHKLINSIPKEAAVSAQSPFVPHLSCRDNIYQFPIIKNADYIILAPKESYYPIDDLGYFKIIDSLSHSSKWKTIKKNEHFLIFKRK